MVLERSSPNLMRLVFALATLIVGLIYTAPKAEAAGWRLCNETSFILEAATGRPEGNVIVVEGWTRLRPGECREALPAPLTPGAHFVMARSSPAHRGGQRVWTGDVPLCVDTTGSFSVENPPSCTAMGLDSRDFRAVKIDSRSSWTTKFLETEPYGKRAEAAGLQRLINDAGLENVSIDGYVGRRTRGNILRFLNANNLSANTTDLEVMDILEEVARDRGRLVGMTICNRTKNDVWTAIGRRRGNGWESRGWWVLASNACSRVIDESLIATPHYVFAEMEVPGGVRRLKDAEHLFCIARSKFAIVGRDGCGARAYSDVDFLETDAPVDGKLIHEIFEHDFSDDILSDEEKG